MKKQASTQQSNKEAKLQDQLSVLKVENKHLKRKVELLEEQSDLLSENVSLLKELFNQKNGITTCLYNYLENTSKFLN